MCQGIYVTLLNLLSPHLIINHTEVVNKQDVAWKCSIPQRSHTVPEYIVAPGKIHLTRQGPLVAVGQSLTFYLHSYNLWKYLLPASPSTGKKPQRGHLSCKDFSLFFFLLKKSAVTLGLCLPLFSYHQQRVLDTSMGRAWRPPSFSLVIIWRVSSKTPCELFQEMTLWITQASTNQCTEENRLQKMYQTITVNLSKVTSLRSPRPVSNFELTIKSFCHIIWQKNITFKVLFLFKQATLINLQKIN